jgi:hypothetical protein
MKIIRPDPTLPLRTNYASAIYGLIVSMAVIATASQDDGLNSGEIGFWAVATSFVFFLAHVYSHIVAAGITRPRDAKVEVKAVARREWPMVQGAMIPAVVMFMGAVGIFGEDQASLPCSLPDCLSAVATSSAGAAGWSSRRSTRPSASSSWR